MIERCYDIIFDKLLATSAISLLKYDYVNIYLYALYFTYYVHISLF